MSQTYRDPLSVQKIQFRQLVTPPNDKVEIENFKKCMTALYDDCRQREVNGPSELRLRQVLVKILKSITFHDRVFVVFLAMLTSLSIAESVVFDQNRNADADVADFIAYLGAEFDLFVRGLGPNGSQCSDESQLKYGSPESFSQAILTKAWTI